jgi:hypothetical protein
MEITPIVPTMLRIIPITRLILPALSDCLGGRLADFVSGVPFLVDGIGAHEMASATDHHNPSLIWRICPAEAVASGASSASCYHCIEDVRVVAVVEAEGKLVQIQGQIGFADVVVGSDHAALQQAPKGFDAVGVDVAAYIDALTMSDDLMRIVGNLPISRVLVCCQQGHLVGYGLFNEPIKCGAVCSFDSFADNVAFPTDGSNDWHLIAGLTACPMRLFVPMAVLVLTADVGFINFDFAKKLSEVGILHRGPDAYAHIPSRPVVTASNLAMDLKRADSLFALGHQINDLKPSSQGVVGVFEDGFADNREPVAVLLADPALPVPRLEVQLVNPRIFATRALYHAVRPTPFHQELLTGVLGREAVHKLSQRHSWLNGQRLSGFDFAVHE